MRFLNLLEIHKASQKWYLRSDTDSEIEEWFKALHKAAVSISLLVKEALIVMCKQ